MRVSTTSRFLVLNTGSRKRIVDRLALKYYGNLLNLLKAYRLGHIDEPAHLNNASTIFRASMKGIDRQKTEFVSLWKKMSHV